MNSSTNIEFNVNKNSSILDYPYPGLDPDVWGPDGKLLSKHKDTIHRLIATYLEDENLKHSSTWIQEIKIIGSLTTYQYTFDSDLDVHIEVDLSKFIQTEKPELSKQEAHDYLDNLRKQMSASKAVVPGTQHPIEFYFETPQKPNKPNPRGGVYSLDTAEWTTSPVPIDKDFDIEELKPFVVDIANEIAEEMSADLGEIKIDVRRVEELQHVMKVWSGEQRAKYQAKLQEKLNDIEEEIQELLQAKQQLVEDRRDFDPEGDAEIKFKYLQKFGYFAIINALRDFFEDDQQVTEDEIPEIKKILNPTSELKDPKATDQETLLIDFDKTIADNKDVEWPNVGEPMSDVKEALDKLKDDGWKIVIYSCRANDKEGLDQIKDFMDKHDLIYDDIFVGKPHAAHYIDDKGLLFTTWTDVLNSVEKPEKKEASNYPSITPHAPTNRWGPEDVVIPVDPDPVSTEKTYYAPHADKPREKRKSFWEKIVDLFRKKEDPEDDDKKAAPKKQPKPKTTWDRVDEEMEPYRPLPRTFEWTTNENNLNWRYPYKFMKRPTGPGYSNDSEVLWMLEENKEKARKKSSLDLVIKVEESESDRERVEYYKEKIQKGEDVGPILVREEDTTQIVDGNHRAQAYKELEMTPPAIYKVPRIEALTLLVNQSPAEVAEQIGIPMTEKKEASTYTDEEMEKIYQEQHEMSEDPNQGGGFTPRDWNHSTTDYPKPQDLEKTRVHLDLMYEPAQRPFPLSIPSYEVTWLFGLPNDTYHGDY